MRSITAYRREWLPELMILIGLCVLAIALFAATDLDIDTARWFYLPEGRDHWATAGSWPWSTLYSAAPWITASLVVTGIGWVAVGLVRRHDGMRRHGVFLLLAVIVGPGLVVNTILKDHWDRPRPWQIVEFGGILHYSPPLALGGGGGKSFPCGHCSVAFLYAAGWWVWKRRRPVWAWTSLAVGAVAGFASGLGRLAAGGHFLSDTVWAGLIALGIAHALYYYVLRIPAFENAGEPATVAFPPRRGLRLVGTTFAVLGGVGVLVVVFLTPHGEAITSHFDLVALPRHPENFEVIATAANVQVVLVDEPRDRIGVTGELHGFGLPTSLLTTSWEFVADPAPTVRYRITQRGWFTNLDGIARFEVPAGELRRVTVRVERGNIQVTDSTKERLASSHRFALDVQTRAGEVQLP